MIILFSILFLAALGVLLYLYLHKRSAKLQSPISSLATVHTPLTPNGSVLVRGELWLACSVDGNSIAERVEVTVVGLRDHQLLVAQNH